MSFILALVVVVIGGVLANLRAQVKQLSSDLTAQRSELNELKRRVGGVDTPPIAPPSQLEQAEAEEPATIVGPWQKAQSFPRPERPEQITTPQPVIHASKLPEASEETAAGASAAPGEGKPSGAGPAGDFETALGSRWAVWVGGIALAFGGLFLVRYSIEAGLLGPAARLTVAATFGLCLLAAGETVRRTGLKVPLQGLDSAYIPAILTAAGGFTLFAATYVAHAIYGFIGPAIAFVLLGLIALAILFLSLIHGLALAGLGLLGALIAPALVASEAPNAWALFIYLAVVLLATLAVARIRNAHPLAAMAFFGLGVWTMLYLWNGPVEMPVVMFVVVVMVGSLALLWDHTTSYALTRSAGGWLPYSIVAVFLGLIAAWLSGPDAGSDILFAVAVIALMVLAAAWKPSLLPLLLGAGVAAVVMIAPLAWIRQPLGLGGIEDYVQFVASERLAGDLVAALFLGVGVWKAMHLIATQPKASAAWIFWAGLVALTVIGGMWLRHGDSETDLRAFLSSALAALILAIAAERLARMEFPPLKGGVAVATAFTSAALLAAFALRTGLGPVYGTMAIGAASVIPALATRVRSYPVLGWLCAIAFAITLIRIGLDPTIVGWEALLDAWPFFNILLPAYGIPALAFAFCAWQLARTTDGRPKAIMEVAAVLFTMLTIAMLARHAMTDGDVTVTYLQLAEQSVYTLMALGMGGALIAIGRRSPSPVMMWGSIVLGCLGVASILILHVFALNPLVTDEPTGKVAFFNLLLLGYAMPALACAALALYARGKRPAWYSVMLGLLASALAFRYVNLSLRRLFQGEQIGWWRGMYPSENYAYSALWLAFGVALLFAGMHFRFYALRLASAALIALAVIKVFLFDMSNLEGILRALSFIGLGVILIGIGLAYQRLLRRGASLN